MELELLFSSENITLANVDPQSLDVLSRLDFSDQTLFVNEGSFSGGYAYQVLLRATKALLSHSSGDFQFRSTRFVYLYKLIITSRPSLEKSISRIFHLCRNADLRECVVEKDGEKLKFAIVNGFKNIQNIVQKMKRKRHLYDYVEIMACPSGNIDFSLALISYVGVCV